MFDRSLWLLAILAASASLAQAPGVAPDAPVKWTKVHIYRPVPDDLKPTGAHGTVVLEADLSPEKKMANTHLAAETKPTVISDYILNKFANAPVDDEFLVDNPTKIRLTIGVYNSALDYGENYSCHQADLDADWHAREFGTKEIEKIPLYLLMSMTGATSSDKKWRFARDPQTLDRAWAEAIERCRAAPNVLFVVMLVAQGNKAHGS